MFEFKSFGIGQVILAVGMCLVPASATAQAPERFQGILASTASGASVLSQWFAA